MNRLNRGFSDILVVLIIGAAIVITGGLILSKNITKKTDALTANTIATEKPVTKIENYEQPTITEKDAYTVIFVGDSMTEALGENFDILRQKLAVSKPDKVFGLFNYGFGSTSILTLNQRLKENTEYNGRQFEAILDREFEVIIIESFGHNPLSNLPLNEGLKEQEKALDEAVLGLVKEKPGSLIVFLASVSPSREYYGAGQVDLSPEVRAEWADERRAYMENFITYAKNHNIPVINVYEKSMDENRVTNLDYVSKTDYIHPSSTGVELISSEVDKFLSEVLP